MAEEKEEPSKTSQWRDNQTLFQTSINFSRSSKNGPQHWKVSIIERHGHGVLFSYKKSMMSKRNKQTNHHGHISENSEISPRSFRQVLPEQFQKKTLLSREMTAPCLVLSLKTFQQDKMWSWNTVILGIMTLYRVRLMCVCVSVFNKKKFKKYKN